MIVSDHGNGRLDARTKGGRHLEIRAAKLSLDSSDVYGSLPSPAYRLEMHGRNQWSEVALEQAIIANLQALDEQRLYARSLLAGGDEPDPARTKLLTQTEIIWLRMRLAATSGMWSVAARHALELPPDRYPDHLIILGMALARDTTLTERVRDHASSVDGSLGAAIRFLAGDSAPIRHNDIVGAIGPLPDDITRLANGELPAVPTLAERALIEPKQEWTSEDLAELYRINAHLAETVILAARTVPEEAPPQLVNLIAPEQLDDQVLRELENWGELARRRYVDGSGFDGLPDGAVVRHYRALRGLRLGEGDGSGLCSSPVADAIVRSIESGVLDHGLLVDDTVWPVIRNRVRVPEDIEQPSSPVVLIAEASTALFAWDFDAALASALEVLRRSSDEAIRDEALNIMAYCYVAAGNAEAAIAALEHALEGEYTFNLIANAGIVTERLDPASAAGHITRLAREAPTVEMKVAAARHALTVWQPTRQAWEDENASNVTLPGGLIDVIRDLLVTGTTLDDHRDFMQLLASWDREWLSDPANTSQSSHAASIDHRFYVAQAKGDPSEMVELLISGLRASDPPAWLEQERDHFVDGLVGVLIDPENDSAGPALFALEAIEQGLPLRPIAEVVMTASSVTTACRMMAEQEGEPADTLLQRLRRAEQVLVELSAEEQRRLGWLLEGAFNSYSVAVHDARVAVYNTVLRYFREMIASIAHVPRRRINWRAVDESKRALLDMCRESSQQLQALVDPGGPARSSDLADAVRNLAKSFNELEQDIRRFPR